MVSALAGVVAVPAVMIACNDIIGLSDYRRVECTGLVCDGGGFEDGAVDAGDGGTEPGKVDASGTQPVSWAAWPMPNYVMPDASPDATDNPLSYKDTQGGFVDEVTGLVWAHPMPAEAVNQTFEGAKTLCEKLQSGPWRLPSRIELVTLLDLSKAGAAKIDPTFAGTPASAHWTFSEDRSFPGPGRQYWVVDFGTGGLAKRAETTTAAVRCVKDGT